MLSSLALRPCVVLVPPSPRAPPRGPPLPKEAGVHPAGVHLAGVHLAGALHGALPGGEPSPPTPPASLPALPAWSPLAGVGGATVREEATAPARPLGRLGPTLGQTAGAGGQTCVSVWMCVRAYVRACVCVSFGSYTRSLSMSWCCLCLGAKSLPHTNIKQSQTITSELTFS